MAAIVSGLVAAWTYGEAWQSSREAGAAPAALIGPERMLGTELAGPTFQRAIKDARLRLAFERKTRRAAERASQQAKAEAAEERSLRVSAEETAKQLAEQLARAQKAADRAQTAATTAEDKLAKERAKERVKQLTKQPVNGKPNAHIQLAREVEKAQQAAADARAELARAEAAKATAEKEAKETRARLTFVSLNAKKDAEQAIAGIREQMLHEKSAREQAEREARNARYELARERRLRQAAWSNVERLKRRLAAAGVKVTTGQAPKKAVARKKVSAVPKPVAAKPRVPEKGWSLSSGPVFVKDGGLQ
jgi:chromosome segregation ATPase